MTRTEIEQVKQHFAGNDRVAFREVPFEDYPETTEVTVYVNGEMLPGAGMIDTGFDTGKRDIGNIIASIENTLGLDRAELEAELRELISSTSAGNLRTLIRMAKDFDPRKALDALYSVDAEGSHADEAWSLEQIMRSNPDTFDEDDIEKLRRLPVGRAMQFGGGAWATCTIKRVS